MPGATTGARLVLFFICTFGASSSCPDGACPTHGNIQHNENGHDSDGFDERSPTEISEDVDEVSLLQSRAVAKGAGVKPHSSANGVGTSQKENGEGVTAVHMNLSRTDSHLVEHVESVLQHNATQTHTAVAKRRRTTNYMIQLDQPTRRRRHSFRQKCLKAGDNGYITFADCDTDAANQQFTLVTMTYDDGTQVCRWKMNSNSDRAMRFYDHYENYNSDRFPDRDRIGMCINNYMDGIKYARDKDWVKYEADCTMVSMTLSWLGRRRTHSYIAMNADAQNTKIGVEVGYDEKILVQNDNTDTKFLFWDADTGLLNGNGEANDMPCEV